MGNASARAAHTDLLRTLARKDDGDQWGTPRRRRLCLPMAFEESIGHEP
jgi:hypothetical protein